MPKKLKERVTFTDSIVSLLVQFGSAITPVGAILMAFVSGYVAMISGIFEKYYPFSLLAAALLGALIFAITAGVAARTYLWWVTARARSASSKAPDVVNPMDSIFERRRINPTDLTLRFDNAIRGKTFVDCEIVGPVMLLFSGCNFSGGGFPVNCDFVEIVPNCRPANVVWMRECTFTNCRFYEATVFFPSQIRNDFLPFKDKWLTHEPKETTEKQSRT